LEFRKDEKKFGAEGKVGTGDSKEWDWSWADGGKIGVEKRGSEGIEVYVKLAGDWWGKSGSGDLRIRCQEQLRWELRI
jgi:hypothetical protein